MKKSCRCQVKMLDTCCILLYNRRRNEGKGGEEEEMKDDLAFLRLWDLYSPLLTATQREITDLYFNYDLSLAEIAEQKGVSRQSISDCLNKSRKQLENYEKKLGFSKIIDEMQAEITALKNSEK